MTSCATVIEWLFLSTNHIIMSDVCHIFKLSTKSTFVISGPNRLREQIFETILGYVLSFYLKR